MATFTTTEISGIASAIKWMRFPLSSEGDSGSAFVGSRDQALAKKLAGAKAGSGHDCFLKAVTVHFEVEAPHYWWNHAQRYHFWDIASSTSKMHSIHSGDIGDKCSKWVSKDIISMVNTLIEVYNDYDEHWNPLSVRNVLVANEIDTIGGVSKTELFECILDNTPLGYQLKAGWVTNYLQLKTVYAQRKNHKLSHWNTDFVEWVKSLPMCHLITGEE